MKTKWKVVIGDGVSEMVESDAVELSGNGLRFTNSKDGKEEWVAHFLTWIYFIRISE